MVLLLSEWNQRNPELPCRQNWTYGSIHDLVTGRLDGFKLLVEILLVVLILLLASSRYNKDVVTAFVFFIVCFFKKG